MTDIGDYIWGCFVNTTNQSYATAGNWTLYVTETGEAVGKSQMLYLHWQMLGVGGILFTFLGFANFMEKIGRLFFLLLGAIDWIVMSLGTLKFRIIWDGGRFLNYTYMPVNGQEALALIPGFFGIILFVVTYYHAVQWFAYEPLMTASRRIE